MMNNLVESTMAVWTATADALLRVTQADIGVYALLVDAKDEAAESFYRRFGFAPLGEETQKLYLPIATALKLIGN